MHSLRKLGLRGSSISDDGLLSLARLPALVELDLRYTKGAITPEGLDEFRRLKPECRVVTGEG